MKKLVMLLVVALVGCAGYVPPAPITKPNYTGRDFLATTYPHCADYSGSGYAIRPCDQGLGSDSGTGQ